MRPVLLAVVACVSLAVAAGAPLPQTLPGWQTYDRYCLACHGAAGDGRGPAAPYSSGKPRDFTAGAFKWRSTSVGEAPTDDDLRRAIRHGAAGTSMPAFDGILSATEVDELVAIIKSFAPATFAKRGKVISLSPPPPPSATRGAELWTQQGCERCHGASGFDLTREPLRRTGPDKRTAIATTIATGITGSGMPGYSGAIGDRDLWALADHVIAINATAKQRPDRSVLDLATINADATARIEVGTWPGTDPEEARVFGAPVPPQGTPPSSLAPAQASLSSQQCARCHAKQAREWTTTVHAKASSWGLGARELDHAVEEGTSCNRCHTPLAEQQPSSPGYDAGLRAEGITCAGCHVRNWERRGPPRRAPSLLPSSSYPLVELALYERSDLCMTCHQLPPRTAVAGKPLLNTYKEWLEGPYMARGVQCQHCHMPNREHTWLGIHDRETVRQGFKLAATATRKEGVITVVATMTNIGAGHFLPTTPTPALWLRIELFDASGTPILGAKRDKRIGRKIHFDDGWHEDSDTRIPPGNTSTLAGAWTKGRTPKAVTARITVDVHPDDFYEGLYAERLAAKLPTATRTAYEAALSRARASHYVAEQIDIPIALDSKR